MSPTVPEIYELISGLPAGAWVAISLSDVSILSFGDDADVVFDEAIRKGDEHPLITRVPDPEWGMFFG